MQIKRASNIEITHLNNRVTALQANVTTLQGQTYGDTQARRAVLHDYNGLFRNGSGQTGDNSNWGLLARTDTRPFGADQSFYRQQNYQVWRNDDVIPVDPAFVYRLQLSARWISKVTAGISFYAGLTYLDRDSLEIHPYYAMRQPATDTTLARDLKEGDTKVYLTSAANWPNTTGAAHYRNFAFFNYRDSTGFEYKRSQIPYTRHVTYVGQPRWDAGAVNQTENSITLLTPWSGFPNPYRTDGVWPAGTEVSAAMSGGSYNYSLFAQWQIDQTGQTDWETRHSFIGGGIQTDGRTAYNRWRAGTAGFQMLALLNHPTRGVVGTSGDIIAIAGAYVDRTPLSRQMAGLT